MAAPDTCGHSPRSQRLQALDIDGDADADLVLALDGKPPAIWVNPGLATSGIAPTGAPTATQGNIFTLDATLTTASDVTLADINGDGRTDIVLAYETGFEVILAPAGGSAIVDWQAAGAAAKKVAAPAKRIMVADMDNDGYPDIVVAGASASSPESDRSNTTIYFGSAATKSVGDYSAAESVQVGALIYTDAGAVLALEVADVDGDGWKDVAVTYASTFKRVYFGKGTFRDVAPVCAAAPVVGRDGWSAAEARRFGPASQDSLRITSLELVDLNLDGNLDVLYASDELSGVGRAYVALGRSEKMASIIGDANFIANQECRMRAIDFGGDHSGAQITNVTVSVSDTFHEHAYAGTTNSECRSPADDFYPVETRIEIDFPVIPCSKENFKDCILLDPIAALSSTVKNTANEGVIQCSYEVDLHRDQVK